MRGSERQPEAEKSCPRSGNGLKFNVGGQKKTKQRTEENRLTGVHTPWVLVLQNASQMSQPYSLSWDPLFHVTKPSVIETVLIFKIGIIWKRQYWREMNKHKL